MGKGRILTRRMVIKPKTTNVTNVPGVRFENRKIFLECYFPSEPRGQALAVALGRILKEELFAVKAEEAANVQPTIET